MFLLDWLYGILAFLGLYRKEAKILVSGRNNDAKTDLHNWLRTRDLIQKDPSIGKIKFKALESAGVLISPRVWRDYYVNVKIDAVVYLVDFDYYWEGRLREELPHFLPARLRDELLRLLEDNSLANVPFLIFVYESVNVTRFMNPSRFRTETLSRDRFGLTTTGKGKINLDDGVRPIEIFMYDIHKQMGYCNCSGLWDGFRWLSQYIR